jgi:hypothetical protein
MFLAILGILFFSNYRLFLLLEREDWPALAYYLEQKIFVKNRYSNRNVRLLAGSYLVISDYSSVINLEKKTFLVKPAIIAKNALVFGVARILSGKYEKAAAFFSGFLNSEQKVKYKKVLSGNILEWVRWYFGFSNLLNSSFSQAETIFLSLAVSSSDALVTGLSAYFLHNNLAKNSPEPESQSNCLTTAENGRKRVIKALQNAEGWKNETDRMTAEIHISIIRKYIDSAGNWLFNKKTGA